MEKQRRSAIRIMAELIKLLKPLLFSMFLAITSGTVGFLLAFGLGILGGYALLSAIPGLQDGLKYLPFGGFSTNTYLVAMVVCAILRGLLHYAEQFCNHYIAFKILARIRNKVFYAMRKLAPAKLEGKNQGNLIALIMGDIELLEVFYAHTISPISIAFLITILLFVFMMQFHPLIALLCLFGQVVIGIIIPVIATKKGNRISMSIRNNIGELNGEFLDKLRGLREILGYNQGDKVMSEIDQLTGDILVNQKRLKNQGAAVQAWTDTVMVVISIAQVLLCTYLTINGIIPIQVAFIACLTQLSTYAPYINLATLGNTLTQTFACGERVLSLMEEEPVVSVVTDGIGVTFKELQGEGVTFSYKEDEDEVKVLNNLDFNVNKGEILGIMGKSGCGKSTLLKLIMRFWDVDRGKITMSKENLKRINTKDLYSHISYMTQSTVLFTGTIRDNLLVANDKATEEEMYDALKKASLYDYIVSLPKGLDTYVAELGDNFSGGERQRIGLARCFLADRDVMLLDEPTSNLDSQNEAIILRAIDLERKDKTVVLVSHRASTLGVCDRVIPMKDGRFVS